MNNTNTVSLVGKTVEELNNLKAQAQLATSVANAAVATDNAVTAQANIQKNIDAVNAAITALN